jgi:hypothetical protein
MSDEAGRADGAATPLEWAFAAIAVCAGLALGIYQLDAGCISDYRSGLIAATIERYPGLLDVMKADREQAYKTVFGADMPKDLSLDDYIRKQSADRSEDTWVASADAGDSLLVPAKVPRLIRKQILGSVFGDEPNTLAAVGRINPKTLSFNPKWFFYGGAYIYPVAGFTGAGTILFHGFKVLSLDAVLRNPVISRTMYSSARFFGVLCGLAASIVLGVVVGRLYGSAAGCSAVVLTATTPFFVMFGHLAKPYNTASLFAFASVWFTLRRMETASRRNFIGSAIGSGLSVGCNYVFIYFSGLLPLWMFIDFVRGGTRDLAGRIAALAKSIALYMAIVAITFLVVNPFWLIQFDIVKGEITMANPSNLTHFGHIQSKAATLYSVVASVTESIVYSVGAPMLILFLVAVPLIAWRVSKRTLPQPWPWLTVALWGAPFIFGSMIFNGLHLQQSMHYICGFAILFFPAIAFGALAPAMTRLRPLWLLVLALAFTYNTAHSWFYLGSLEDMSERSAEFGKVIEELVPKGASITTMLTVVDTPDSFSLHVKSAPPIWTSVILPDFDFLAREWRFRHHVMSVPTDRDAEWILDTFGDLSAEPSPALRERYEIVASSPRRYFLPGTWRARLFPRLVVNYGYADYVLWRKKPTIGPPGLQGNF